MKNKKLLIVGIILVVVVVLCGLCSVGTYVLFQYSLDSAEESGADIIEFYEEDYVDPGSSGIDETETCDSATDDFLSVYRNESLTVIENPCEVAWLLAQEEESYTLSSGSGDTIYVTVWRDWENNTTPGTTFSIRALDVEDSGFGFDENREESSILITRWVASEGDLAAAKEEVNEYIEEMK